MFRRGVGCGSAALSYKCTPRHTDNPRFIKVPDFAKLQGHHGRTDDRGITMYPVRDDSERDVEIGDEKHHGELKIMM